MGQPGKSKEGVCHLLGKPARKTHTEWGWMKLAPLVALAETHYSSKELFIFMAFNSGLTRHRNQEHCKHLSVFTVISVGNLEMDYAELLPASFSSS